MKYFKANLSVIFAFLFFYFLSFTAAFSLAKYLPIYIIASFALISYAFFSSFFTGFPLVHRSRIDNYVLAYTLYAFAVGLFLPNTSTGNYLVVFFFLYPFLYYSIRFIALKIGIFRCLRINFYAFLLIAGFVIFEFLMNYLFSFNIQDFIPRPFLKILMPLFGILSNIWIF